jgi:hypothetical protein
LRATAAGLGCLTIAVIIVDADCITTQQSGLPRITPASTLEVALDTPTDGPVVWPYSTYSEGLPITVIISHGDIPTRYSLDNAGIPVSTAFVIGRNPITL